MALPECNFDTLHLKCIFEGVKLTFAIFENVKMSSNIA